MSQGNPFDDLFGDDVFEGLKEKVSPYAKLVQSMVGEVDPLEVPGIVDRMIQAGREKFPDVREQVVDVLRDYEGPLRRMADEHRQQEQERNEELKGLFAQAQQRLMPVVMPFALDLLAAIQRPVTDEDLENLTRDTPPEN